MGGGRLLGRTRYYQLKGVVSQFVLAQNKCSPRIALQHFNVRYVFNYNICV